MNHSKSAYYGTSLLFPYEQSELGNKKWPLVPPEGFGHRSRIAMLACDPASLRDSFPTGTVQSSHFQPPKWLEICSDFSNP